jgi:hypothetical protein
MIGRTGDPHRTFPHCKKNGLYTKWLTAEGILNFLRTLMNIQLET